MRPTAELWNDHAVLRAKLDLLEGLLPLVSTTQFPVRDLVYSIARRLRCHTEKEGVMLAALRGVRPQAAGDALAHLAEEHRDQRETLEILQELLSHGRDCPTEAVMAYGGHLIDELREHMAHEEARVFPLADQTLEAADLEEASQHMQDIAHRHYPEGEPHLPGTRPASCPITQEMTVNHVLWARPYARPVLEAFHIDCDEDGCCCLDELYWKRGVDVDALVRALNAAAPDAPARAAAAQLQRHAPPPTAYA